MFKKLKKAMQNYLNDLAKENQKVYGKGGLDCCKLNRKDSNTITK